MNKLIVVTGGTKGIGRALVQRFARAGFDIITCSRSPEDLAELKNDIEAKYPGIRLYVATADLSNRKGTGEFCRYVKSLNRLIDVLVNNAGYFLPGGVSTEPEGALEEMVNANLYSAYHTTRALLPGIKRQEKAHIFNLCSIASLMAYPNGGSYTIVKFALLGFSKCLREELKGEGVRVTAVMPGATFTASWEGTDYPEERFMPAEDIAETIYSAYSLSSRTVVEEIILRPQLGDL